MARTRFPADAGLTSRMTLVMFLLGALFVAVFVGVLFYAQSVVLALLIGGGLLAAQYFGSDKIAMASMRAREVTPEQAPKLHGIIDRLCALADMPKPRVAMSDTTVPNAFATGRNEKHAVVCVTTGLMARLDESEVEAVLAHELSHIAHRDVMVMTIAGFLGMVAGLVLRFAYYSSLFGGGRQRDENQGLPVVLVVMIGSIVVYAISFLLTRALSRYRELSADRAAAVLTGRPATLASALTKVSGQMASIPTRDLRSAEPVSALLFAPALSGRGKGGPSLSAIFSTHPPLEQRLDQLARIEADMGRST